MIPLARSIKGDLFYRSTPTRVFKPLSTAHLRAGSWLALGAQTRSERKPNPELPNYFSRQLAADQNVVEASVKLQRNMGSAERKSLLPGCIVVLM